MHVTQRLARLLVAATALALAACANQTVVKTLLEANDKVNPDAHGRPSPVVVRVYMLKTPTAFHGNDFFSVFEKDQATLGTELLDREEFQMMPGDKRIFRKDLASEARFIGVVAGFRDLERSQWRASVEVRPKKTNYLRIRLDTNRVSITPY